MSETSSGDREPTASTIGLLVDQVFDDARTQTTRVGTLFLGTGVQELSRQIYLRDLNRTIDDASFALRHIRTVQYVLGWPRSISDTYVLSRCDVLNKEGGHAASASARVFDPRQATDPSDQITQLLLAHLEWRADEP